MKSPAEWKSAAQPPILNKNCLTLKLSNNFCNINEHYGATESPNNILNIQENEEVL